jgi:hypothetical protein
LHAAAEHQAASSVMAAPLAIRNLYMEIPRTA